MNEQWGEWIEHDGKGCPVVGRLCRVETASGAVYDVIPKPEANSPSPGRMSLWVWSSIDSIIDIDVYWRHRVMRYRVRKSPGFDAIVEAMNEAVEDAKRAGVLEDA